MATRMLPTTTDSSVVIRATSGSLGRTQGYQEGGLSGKTGGTDSGAAQSHTYYYKIAIDGGSASEKSIVTPASTVTFTVLIGLMNTANRGATWSITGADFRCTSDRYGTASSIALTAGTTGDNLFAAITGWSVESAVAGTGPAEDPTGIALIASGGYSHPYPIQGAGQVVVQLYGDTNVTGTPAVEVGFTGTGPWANVATVTNPTTAGAVTPVPFGTVAARFVRINAGSYTGGALRASLSATMTNGNMMW